MMDRLTFGWNGAASAAQQAQSREATNLARSTERLSSGLRINRAADDAAGQAIAEKLSAQVRGLAQANANAQDAINLIQTADGALSQTTNILQRMRELVVQAGNDTYTQTDREKIQAEIEQLKNGLTQIAKGTQFNGRHLLDGSISPSRFMDPNGAFVLNNPIVGTAGVDADYFIKDFNIGFLNPVNITDVEIKLYQSNPPPIQILGFQVIENGSVRVDNSTYNTTARGVGRDYTPNLTQGWGVDVQYSNAIAVSADIGKSFKLRLDPTLGPITIDHALEMQVGGNQGQTIRVGARDVSAFGLRLESLSVIGQTEADSHQRVDEALRSIDSALQRVNEQRTTLGATQNRLAETVQNLGNAQEQQQIARSGIQDTDVAKESAQLTRAQVMQQATTSLLAQANTLPEMALKLLDSPKQVSGH